MSRIAIVMPQMGQSVAEGTIVRWEKNQGESVQLDEVVLEVETDKTTVEVESPSDGTLVSCLKEAGEIAAAGEVIAFLEVEDGAEAAESDRPHADAFGDQVTVTAYNFNVDPNADMLQGRSRSAAWYWNTTSRCPNSRPSMAPAAAVASPSMTC